MARIFIAMFCGMAVCLGARYAHAQADAFWCGTHLIRGGLAATEIVGYCGEPSARDVLEEPVMARRPNGSMFQIGVKTTEFWTYDRGSRSFPARITVEDGIATAVELVRRE